MCLLGYLLEIKTVYLLLGQVVSVGEDLSRVQDCIQGVRVLLHEGGFGGLCLKICFSAEEVLF